MRLILGSAVVLLAACAPATELTNTWKDPSAQGVKFNKIVAICQCRDEATRRTVEDQLAKRIQRTTPSYTLIGDQELRDPETAKAKVKEAGFDGAIVLQLANVDRQTTYVPGQPYVVAAPYTSMWGGWGYGWSAVYDPGYVREDQYVDFNTYVYSVADEKLIWASRSQTDNPSSVPELIDEVIDANAAAMKKQGVIG